jgi:hypothetical protein
MQTVDPEGRGPVVRRNPGWPDLAQEFWQIGSSLRSEICSEGGGFSGKFVCNDRFVFNGKL